MSVMENVKSKYNGMPDSTKALVKMGLIFLILIIVFIILISVIGSGNKGQNFKQFENTVIRASKNYVANDEGFLDDEVAGSKKISLDTLVNKGYLKELTKYLGKNKTCTGGVLVYKNLDYYEYIPKLDCGSDYKNESFVDHFMENNPVVESGAGLYQVGDDYIFRGKDVDNYVSYAGTLWRIISVDSDGNFRLFQQKAGEIYSPWDKRYNSVFKSSVGINDYYNIEASEIKNKLEDLYNGSTILSDEAKAIVVPKQICIGKRTLNEPTKDNSVECQEKSELSGLSLLTVSDILYPSLDEGCVNSSSKECMNYNYLANIISGWTITASADKTSKVYSASIPVSYSDASASKKIKVVVNVFGNINYISGDGTEANPYVLQ